MPVMGLESSQRTGSMKTGTTGNSLPSSLFLIGWAEPERVYPVSESPAKASEKVPSRPFLAGFLSAFDGFHKAQATEQSLGESSPSIWVGSHTCSAVKADATISSATWLLVSGQVKWSSPV